jgi:hypothetical protein
MITVNALITSGQKETGIQVIMNAVRKGMDEMLNDLSTHGVINRENFQTILAQGGTFAPTLAYHLVTEAREMIMDLAQQAGRYLKVIGGNDEPIVIGRTTGLGFYSNTTAQVSIDHGFRNQDEKSRDKPTNEMPVRVLEVIKSGSHAQVFGGLGQDLNRLCLSRDQIVSFAVNHCRWFGIGNPGDKIDFLYRVNGEFCVARARMQSGLVEISWSRLSDTRGLLFCGQRIVIPKL